MSLVNVRELKTNTTQLLHRVRQQGEIIDIIYKGEIVARLVPVLEIKPQTVPLSDLWLEMDRLAGKVDEQWSGNFSAVAAVREVRREL
jgi:antitoxin (DNA-binding transcriptional repressor) of toxin-antitoxin stability system